MDSDGFRLIMMDSDRFRLIKIVTNMPDDDEERAQVAAAGPVRWISDAQPSVRSTIRYNPLQ